MAIQDREVDQKIEGAVLGKVVRHGNQITMVGPLRGKETLSIITQGKKRWL